MVIGDRVRVTLHNGYVDKGTIVRFFKNGAVRVKEDMGVTTNRRREELVVIKACGGSCLTCASACTAEVP